MNASSADQREEVDSAENASLSPLSMAQYHVWLLEQRDNSHCASNLSDALVITGNLNVAALRSSFSAVIQRHEILRTRIRTVSGEPMQFIASQPDITVSTTDLRKLGPDERLTKARQLVEAEAWTPFDLTKGPLLRAKLVRTEEEQHVLFLGLHRIICDDKSESILMDELLEAYQTFVEGKKPTLSKLPIQFTDYAQRQRTLVENRKNEEQLAYWLAQLSDLPVLELPNDRPRPLTRTFSGGSERIDLPPRVADTLKKFSASEGATLFMTVLAAFQVLLAHYSGQEDIPVASHFENRSDDDTEHLIGFFSNAFVCRTQLGGNPTFREVVRRVRETVLEAYRNQDLPFESIVEALASKQEETQNPFYQVMFSLRENRSKSYSTQNLRLERIEIEDRSAESDLSLRLFDGQDGLWGHLKYNTNLFDSTTIQGITGNFRTLIESIAVNPEAPILELTRFDHPESKKILLQRHDISRNTPLDVRLHRRVLGLIAKIFVFSLLAFGAVRAYQFSDYEHTQKEIYLSRLAALKPLFYDPVENRRYMTQPEQRRMLDNQRYLIGWYTAIGQGLVFVFIWTWL